MALTEPIRYGDPAGGALQGTYPNPDIQDGYIQTRHISLEAITNELIAPATITGDKLSSGLGLGEIITIPENIASGVITSAHLADIITYIRNQGNQSLSGIKSFERAVQYRWPTIPADLANKHYVDSMILSGGGANPNLESYISGIGALAIINQSNIVILSSYASGTKILLDIVQINQTGISNTVSGINSTINTIQLNQTSINNTLSGVIVDLRELTEYASGIGARPTGGGSTATGSSIRQTYTQSHDFTALTAIYRTTGEQWAKAKADNIVTAESIGIIESVSGNQFTVVFEGEIENQTGLLAGFTYFLSADTAGEITPSEPTTSGTISKPVLNAISADKGIVVSYRGILNGISGSTTDVSAIEQYASGIESMRREMVTGGDTTAVTNYASGIENQLINFQNEQTEFNINISNSASGINNNLIDTQDRATTLELLISGIYYNSAGVYLKPSIEDTGSGSVTIGLGEYLLFSDREYATPLNREILSGGTFELVNHTVNYIVASCSPTPQVIAITDRNLINQSCVIPIYTIYREDNELHILDWDLLARGLSNKLASRIVRTSRFVREGDGLILNEAPTRVMTVSDGLVWYGATRIYLSGCDSSADICELWYHSGNGWGHMDIDQYNNTQYDDGTGLADLSVARYGVNWVFRGVEYDRHLFVVLGRSGTYKAAEAEASSLPEIPPILQSHGMLVGRIIVLNGSDTAYAVQSAFITPFNNTPVVEHNDLLNIQGGQTNEYYHLTASEYTATQNLPAYASGINDQLTLIQNEQTIVNNTLSNNLSGINALSINNQTNINIVSNNLSGVNNTVNVLQTNQTSINNTLSGVIVDLRENEAYASGNKTLLLNHVDQHRENATDALNANPFNGFENRTDSNLTISGFAFQITTPSSYNFYSNGFKFTKTTTLSEIPNNNLTQHFVYFDTNGNIQISTTAWDVSADTVPIATVYRVNDTFAIGEERHGYKRDRNWHKWAHSNIGAQFNNGYAGTFNNTSFSFSRGVIDDEDISNDSLETKTSGRLWYRTNAGSALTFASGTTTTPYALSGGNLQWDNAGVLTSVSISKFVCNYLYGTNDKTYPIYIIVGQAEHNTLALARNDNIPNYTNVSTREWKLLYRVIYQNVAGIPTYIEATDYRATALGPGSSYTPASHTDLTNRDAADSHPVTAITGLDNYLSGTKTLITLNQSNIVNVTDYASGIEAHVINVQANAVQKTDYDENTILVANTDNNPQATLILPNRIVGRLVGNTSGLTITQVLDMTGAGAEGDILCRNVDGWEYISKGNAGDLLSQTLTIPEWSNAVPNAVSGVQSDISRLEPLISGIQQTTFYIDNRVSTHIVPNAKMLFWDSDYFYSELNHEAGYNILETVKFSPHVPAYWSGTMILAMATDATVSGINLSLINLENYASGIETLRRAMTTGTNPALESFASGINDYAQLLAPKDGDFWLQSRNRIEINGGKGLAFNTNDFGLEIDSNPGLLDGYTYSLNAKYANAISGVNTKLATSVKRVITHPTALTIFRAVYKDTSNTWQYSKANILENSEVVGIVESTSGNQSTIVMQGTIANPYVTAGVVYYLSDITDGALQTSEATNISKPVMIGIDSGVGIVQIFRSLIVSGSSNAVALPLNYLAGMETAPYTTSGISVATGKCRSKEVLNDTYNIIASSTNIKKLTGPFVTGSMQNGIDSGNREASTTYHVYEITDGTNADTLFSKSATSPTMPSGYVAARRIMSLKTDSTGYIPKYDQFGDQILLLNPILDINAGTVSTTPTNFTFSVPTGIKVKPLLNHIATKAAVNANYYMYCPDLADLDVSQPAQQSARSNAAGEYSASLTGLSQLRTNTSGQLRFDGDYDGTTIYIRLLGWIDTRGK